MSHELKMVVTARSERNKYIVGSAAWWHWDSALRSCVVQWARVHKLQSVK